VAWYICIGDPGNQRQSISMEKSMEPTLQHIAPFTVAGISTRTINSDEGDPVTSKIGPLWSRFFAEGIMEKIVDPDPTSAIHGVYSEYESDLHGHYTLTIGMRVGGSGSQGEGIAEVGIEGGDYLVFEKQGSVPGVVVETWEAIWDYFSKESGYSRRYTTDFEEYHGNEGVAIYIAVRKQ
jgi:predicted transcriptional regulator YdeE